MKLQILDLDGSITSQEGLLAAYPAATWPAQHWGPAIRLACSFRRFGRFEDTLNRALETDHDRGPAVALYGSGDFHHVSLALVRRVNFPINLLVLDNHPDWMRAVPFLHCGTWLYHAARLPQVERVFHLGGDVDFDNYYRCLAPWSLLRSGKISVVPAIRSFRGGAWAGIATDPIRSVVPERAEDRIGAIVDGFRTELAKRPIYISLDKDVMVQEAATVNWDSGHLSVAEVLSILGAFLRGSGGNLAGMDITGDWSRVTLQGGLRRLMHFTMHPALSVDRVAAARSNEDTNLKVLAAVRAALDEADAGLLRLRRTVNFS
jgi:hypothetical protein